MNIATTKPSDERLTPEWLLELARKANGGRFGLDPCTRPDNPTGADRFYTAERDGRRTHRERLGNCPRGSWWNPPSSDIGEWVRWFLRSQTDRAQMLLPLDTTTQYTHQLQLECDAVALLKRRVKCEDPHTGRVMDVARSCAVWYRGRVAPFRHAYRDHWVVTL